MITLIEAKDFRCFHYVRQSLQPFHVLVGPNASGKTTFLDVIAFLGNLVSQGLEAAVEERTQNFQDLTWGRAGDGFELALEAAIPRDSAPLAIDPEYNTIRYEVAIALDPGTSEFVIQSEQVLLKHVAASPTFFLLDDLFPVKRNPPATILTPTKSRNTKTVVNKVPGGNDNFYAETYPSKGKGWAPAFKLGPRKSALGNLPDDESKFPFSTWLKRLLSEGVQRVMLNSLLIRKASPPGKTRGFRPDGSNLPWVVHALQQKSPESFDAWVEHLKTALPDLEGIRTVERPDDKHRYLVLRYAGGLEVPSWMASDGTLRLLALTIPAYLPDFTGVYLIEEPENGIHPRAVETMFQSLSSVYGAQILLATHSPVVLGMVDLDSVLCFAKTGEGGTDIVSGDRHPALQAWQDETNLGVLFASGVLG